MCKKPIYPPLVFHTFGFKNNLNELPNFLINLRVKVSNQLPKEVTKVRKDIFFVEISLPRRFSSYFFLAKLNFFLSPIGA